MIAFTDLLTVCRKNLYIHNHMGGGVDLVNNEYHLAFFSLSNQFQTWHKAHAPFNQYIERSMISVFRKLGSKINIQMEKGDELILVDSQEKFEAALSNGFKFYNQNRIYRMENPCAEIPIGVPMVADLLPPPLVRLVVGTPWPTHITPIQLRLVMRHLYRFMSPLVLRPYIEALPYITLNQKAIRRLVKLGADRFVHELFYAFYNQHRKTQWWPHIRQLSMMATDSGSTDLFAHYVARAMEDAIGFGDAFRREWKTSTVMSLVNEIRANETFEVMPILADALQDAGCDNEDLLKHLRNDAAVYTLGGWIFRCCGRLTA